MDHSVITSVCEMIVSPLLVSSLPFEGIDKILTTMNNIPNDVIDASEAYVTE